MTPALVELYEDLARTHTVAAAPKYARLVVPGTSGDEPVHGWFRMKEAFSPLLLPTVLADLGLLGRDAISIHDPFSGSGTTLASALLPQDGPRAEVSASEINPFLHLLSDVKARVLTATSEVRDRVIAELNRLRRQLQSPLPSPGPAPTLAAFGQEKFFAPEQLAQLLQLRELVARVELPLAADLAKLALAACVEPCSHLRRDGRALRYYSTKRTLRPLDAFEEKLLIISSDLALVSPRGEAVVRRGSALDAGTWPTFASVDLVIYSPPYPNNIDYTEVYKLEAFFLQYMESREDFRNQRRRTLRSHPSIDFGAREAIVDPQLSARVEELAAPLISAIPQDKYARQRAMVINGYLMDMAAIVQNAARCLVPGGAMVCVVGNSRHGADEEAYTVASDLLIAELGTVAGLRLNEIKIARALHRRGRQEHLRESLVFMTKDKAGE